MLTSKMADALGAATLVSDVAQLAGSSVDGSDRNLSTPFGWLLAGSLLDGVSRNLIVHTSVAVL